MRKPNRRAPSPQSIAGFASAEHRDALVAKLRTDSLVMDEDLWAWHAYNYGWRRVMLQTRDDVLAIDPGRHWYDAALAAEAEIFYCRKFHKQAPPIGKPQQRGERTPEEVAHVERCVQQIIAMMAAFDARNRAVWGPRQDDRDALRRVREALGVTATILDPIGDALGDGGLLSDMEETS